MASDALAYWAAAAAKNVSFTPAGLESVLALASVI